MIVQRRLGVSVRHYGHALADEYAKGAEDGGHEVRLIDVATLGFLLLRTKDESEIGFPPDSIKQAQGAIRWADHLVILYPLWLVTMPALLKAFIEQVFHPGFACEYQKSGRMPEKRLAGKSAGVVTMGMSAFIYRWFFFAHSLKSFERNILGFTGIGPIKAGLIGGIEGMTEKQRAGWLDVPISLSRPRTPVLPFS